MGGGLCEGGWEGEKNVFSLLSLTLRRREGEVPGSGHNWDITGLPLVTSLYDLGVTEVTEGRDELGAIVLGGDVVLGSVEGDRAEYLACSTP